MAFRAWAVVRTNFMYKNQTARASASISRKPRARLLFGLRWTPRGSNTLRRDEFLSPMSAKDQVVKLDAFSLPGGPRRLTNSRYSRALFRSRELEVSVTVMVIGPSNSNLANPAVNSIGQSKVTLTDKHRSFGYRLAFQTGTARRCVR